MNSGQIGVELKTLEGMTPEEKAALIRGEYLPERLAGFNRSRNSREDMLRQQIDTANRLAESSTPIQTNNTPAAVAAIIANTLRGFGGTALAHMRSKDLAAAQAEGDRGYEELMRMGEQSTGAGLSTKQRGLSDALRGWGGSI